MVTAPGERREVLTDGRGPEGRNRGQLRTGIVITAFLAGAAGVVAGGAGVHAWDGRHVASSASAPAPTPGSSPQGNEVTFSLGAQTGGLTTPGGGGAAVLALSVVVTNHGSIPETIQKIVVSGPGASFVPSPAGGPPTGLPQVVDAGRSVKIRFGLASNCAVAVRPLPAVSFVLQDSVKGLHTVPAAIPDLDSVWGMSLVPPACGLT